MSERQKSVYSVGLMLSVLMFSLGNGTQGVLLSEYVRHYGLTTIEQGLISTLQSTGMLLSVLFLLLGFLKARKTLTLVVALGAVCVAFALLFLAPAYLIFALLYFSLGVSYGPIDSLGSSITADLYRGSKRSAMHMGIIHACIGIGGIISPAVIGWLQKSGVVWNRILGIYAIIAAAVFAFNLAVYIKNRKQADAYLQADARPTFRENKRFFTAFNVRILLSIAFYGAHQITLLFWSAQYISRVLDNSYIAPAAISLFWAGAVIARFFVPLIRIKAVKYLAFSTLITALVLALSLCFKSAYIMTAGIFLAGLIGGAVTPMGINLLCTRYASNTLFAATAVFVSLYAMQMLSGALSGALATPETLGTCLVVSAVCAGISSLFAFSTIIKNKQGG